MAHLLAHCCATHCVVAHQTHQTQQMQQVVHQPVQKASNIEAGAAYVVLSQVKINF